MRELVLFQLKDWWSRVPSRVAATLGPTEEESREAKLIILEAKDCTASCLPLRPFPLEFTQRLLCEEPSAKLLTIQLITGNYYWAFLVWFWFGRENSSNPCATISKRTSHCGRLAVWLSRALGSLAEPIGPLLCVIGIRSPIHEGIETLCAWMNWYPKS